METYIHIPDFLWWKLHTARRPEVEEMSTELEVGARSFSLHSLPVVHT
jgi:hypothetical protein